MLREERWKLKLLWLMYGQRRKGKMEKVKVFNNDIVSKEIDRLTKLWFCDIWPRSRYTEPERTIHKMRSMAVKFTAERRKKMLHKVVRIVVLNNKGSLVGSRELDEIGFNKNGSMNVLPAKILNEFMAEVDKGGGIFIEKVWAT